MSEPKASISEDKRYKIQGTLRKHIFLYCTKIKKIIKHIPIVLFSF